MSRAAPRRRAEKQRRGRRAAQPVKAYVDPGSPDAVTRFSGWPAESVATPDGTDRAEERTTGTGRRAARRVKGHDRGHDHANGAVGNQVNGHPTGQGTGHVVDGHAYETARTQVPEEPESPEAPESPESRRASAGSSPLRTTAYLRTRTTTTPLEPQPGIAGRIGLAALTLLWLAVVGAGLAGLAANALDLGPELLGGAGAVAVATAYTWFLAARTGGRPLIFGGLALAVGAAVLALDRDELRSGAAVVTAAIAAVLGVMATVPARRFPQVVRETVVAVVIAAIGTVAALGFEPVVTVSRFQYAVLACSLVCAFFLVYRLGAGLHGLGRRGVIVVVVGGVMLAATLLYAEMIRRYGAPGLVVSLHDGVAWCRDHLGGYPRPIEALLGIPALAWGTHMRARRRQGWWVCAFGVALTAPVASTLLNPDLGILESLVSVGYSLVVGLLIGFVVIRIDLLLTGGRGAVAPSGRPAGRRAAREAEDASAVRPEPGRTRALL